MPGGAYLRLFDTHTFDMQIRKLKNVVKNCKKIPSVTVKFNTVFVLFLLYPSVSLA